ncbi:MAG TPA: tyrosine-type recombinase/integrase, partial [Methylocella sp.]
WLHFTQFKNRNRKAVTLDLPLLPELQAAINAGPCGNMTFLVNEYGKPFTTAGFGNRMRKWCDAAGLKGCTSHGLRKAGACIAAENGATEAQLMAIFGWSDPDMAALYTRKARQKTIAAGAMGLIVQRRKEN